VTRAGALRALGVACALALPLALTGAPERASADDGPSWAYDLASDLMSPFCPGRTINDCPSPQAASLKAWILVQAAAGRTREDVEEELYDRYGDVILAAPRSEGFGAAAYWIPVLVFLAGGALVAWFLRRSTVRTASPAPRLDPDVERKLDEMLGGDEVGPR
jgi:cytochrome c-type biogenesis protein CcmH/NrfF